MLPGLVIVLPGAYGPTGVWTHPGWWSQHQHRQHTHTHTHTYTHIHTTTTTPIEGQKLKTECTYLRSKRSSQRPHLVSAITQELGSLSLEGGSFIPEEKKKGKGKKSLTFFFLSLSSGIPLTPDHAVQESTDAREHGCQWKYVYVLPDALR